MIPKGCCKQVSRFLMRPSRSARPPHIAAAEISHYFRLPFISATKPRDKIVRVYRPARPRCCRRRLRCSPDISAKSSIDVRDDAHFSKMPKNASAARGAKSRPEYHHLSQPKKRRIRRNAPTPFSSGARITLKMMLRFRACAEEASGAPLPAVAGAEIC